MYSRHRHRQTREFIKIQLQTEERRPFSSPSIQAARPDTSVDPSCYYNTIYTAGMGDWWRPVDLFFFFFFYPAPHRLYIDIFISFVKSTTIYFKFSGNGRLCSCILNKFLTYRWLPRFKSAIPRVFFFFNFSG